jgi:hypothetical protein
MNIAELWRRQIRHLRQQKAAIPEAEYDRRLVDLCRLYTDANGVHASLHLPLFEFDGRTP